MNTHLYDRIAVTIAIAIDQARDTPPAQKGKVVERATENVLEAVRSELPELIDVEEKWEIQPEENGVHVTLVGDEVHDGRQLTYLSKFATDQGYNAAIVQLHNDLYVPTKDVIVEE